MHEEAEKAFNQQAYELVALIHEQEVEVEPPQNLTGSLASKIPYVLTDMKDGDSLTSKIDILQIKQDIFKESNRTKTGFSNEHYILFEKFLKKVYKQKSISDNISFKFLHDKSFQWILGVHTNKQASSEYCTHIISEINNAVKDYMFSFEVLHLDIEKPFNIGAVRFEYLTAEFFDNYERKVKANKPEFDVTPIREKFQGNVYATYVVKGKERDKAEEFALQECYKAMNVLKLFTPTITIPEYDTSFDIDRRVNKNANFQTLNRNPADDLSLLINWQRGCQEYVFHSQTIDAVVKHSRNFVWLISQANVNELQQLLINALDLFSNAISNSNIHKRITDLFTIWESLLLKDTSVPITHSITLYGSKLLRKSVEDRKQLISELKNMYEIRSAMIHHGKEDDLDMELVVKFQKETINLIETLIRESQKHQNKISLLDEIDNAVHQAY